MAKFCVRVVRIAPQTCVVEVEVPDTLSEAERYAEAEARALEQACDLDFSGREKESTYEVDDVQELEV